MIEDPLANLSSGRVAKVNRHASSSSRNFLARLHAFIGHTPVVLLRSAVS
jgi:hypothetical protein